MSEVWGGVVKSAGWVMVRCERMRWTAMRAMTTMRARPPSPAARPMVRALLEEEPGADELAVEADRPLVAKGSLMEETTTVSKAIRTKRTQKKI